MMTDKIDTSAAAINATAPVVTVKPLVWVKEPSYGHDLAEPDSVQFSYEIGYSGNGQRLTLFKHTANENTQRVLSGEMGEGKADEFKAFAQYDYEQFILSAITTQSEAAIRADERAKVIAEAISICNEVQGGAVDSGLGQMAMGAIGCRRDIDALHTPASRAIAEATP